MDLLVGVVAILKAGVVYVALNAQHPPECLRIAVEWSGRALWGWSEVARAPAGVWRAQR